MNNFLYKNDESNKSGRKYIVLQKISFQECLTKNKNGNNLLTY